MADFNKISRKWQKKWEDAKIFEVKEDPKKKKFYCLEMYPYPSGSGLHMGHVRNYTIGDCFARFKRMQGFNVLYPMGYDSFGLPAENAAIKAKSHPKIFTEDAIKNFIRQQKELGLSYDWSRVIASHTPEYYKWDQWIFLKMFEKGLAFRKKSVVNWCPKCATVLANEQVHDGKCWRHEDTNVEVRDLEQWFFKITDYAEELLKDIDGLQWSEDVKTMQRNWIGRSEGTLVDFEIKTDNNYVLIHGYAGSPDALFFPWLRKELEGKGYKVNVPNLPDTDNPDVIKQAEYVLKNERFDENTVLLGHSLGAAVALKILERLEKPIKKLILAAGFIEPKFKDKKRPFDETFNWKFDFDKIKKNVKDIAILRAKNDYALPPERADKIKKVIGGVIFDFKAEASHICGEKEPDVLNRCLEKIPIFTTRADTLYGVTFMVYAPEHPKVLELVKGTRYEADVKKFIEKVVIEDRFTRTAEDKEKEGMFIGRYAINPLTNAEIPIYIANFVLLDYGTGAIMAVPAHDQRDFDFAKKFKIPIKAVINPREYELNADKMSRAFIGEGYLVNSGRFNDMNNKEAIPEINKFLEKEGIGKKTVQYKLRDWLISRQRFWGCPIPIVYCEKCGIVPVPEKELPVRLPENVEFGGKGNPLENVSEFVNTKCPGCKGKARRETDTMDTFIDSSWYFLRYCDPKNEKEIFDKKKAAYWMPIDLYIGGKEHACMHLIYFRFFTKFLRDLGLVNFDEPAPRLFNQGMLHKGGFVMSKSRGNVVTQEEIAQKYGIDTARLFLLFVASPDKEVEWSDQGIEGMYRLVNKIYSFVSEAKLSKESSKELLNKMHKTIRDVTDHMDALEFNTAIIRLSDYFDHLAKYSASKEAAEAFIKMLQPFAPHLAEELWEMMGNKGFVSLAEWPSYNEKYIDESLDASENFVRNTISDARNVLTLIKKEKPGRITLIISHKWKYDFFKTLKKELKKTHDVRELMSVLMKDFKQHGAEVSKIIPAVVKDMGKMPVIVLDQKTEFEALEKNKEAIEKEFNCGIEVVNAEDSKEQKANNAAPGKAAILVE
ncbi:leucine--tRNA ligase [Candidatus Woesearchaeota archaeon]|nr:leucine--tRNA ligase [Candidatus Woesearchaeota archaeon]